MANSPRIKVFNPMGSYVASVKYLEDAAILAGHYGNGCKVRLGHNGKILWHEGTEKITADISFDRAAEIMASRLARGRIMSVKALAKAEKR